MFSLGMKSNRYKKYLFWAFSAFAVLITLISFLIATHHNSGLSQSRMPEKRPLDFGTERIYEQTTDAPNMTINERDILPTQQIRKSPDDFAKKKEDVIDIVEKHKMVPTLNVKAQKEKKTKGILKTNVSVDFSQLCNVTVVGQMNECHVYAYEKMTEYKQCTCIVLTSSPELLKMAKRNGCITKSVFPGPEEKSVRWTDFVLHGNIYSMNVENLPSQIKKYYSFIPSAEKTVKTSTFTKILANDTSMGLFIAYDESIQNTLDDLLATKKQHIICVEPRNMNLISEKLKSNNLGFDVVQHSSQEVIFYVKQ